MMNVVYIYLITNILKICRSKTTKNIYKQTGNKNAILNY